MNRLVRLLVVRRYLDGSTDVAMPWPVVAVLVGLVLLACLA